MSGLVFRLFVSSTFKDFEEERGILQGKVFRWLRDDARKAGARFVPIDLRWGISPEAAQQQDTMEVCLREVDRCQAEGQPPRLLALLGHRRGWEPLPLSIPADVWARGAAALTAAELSQLERAYWRDDNASPAARMRQTDPNHAELLPSVKKLVEAGGADPRVTDELLGAATEQELLRAFSDQRRRGTDALVLIRKLGQLPSVISDKQQSRASDFIPLRAGSDGWIPDQEDHQKLVRLANELAGEKSPPWAQVRYYDAAWDEAQAAVAMGEEEREAFARLAYTELRQMMAVSLRLEQPDRRQSAGLGLARDQRSHAAISARLLNSFAGREADLGQLRELLPRVALAPTGPDPVVIISGPAGSGKSALLAKAAAQAAADGFTVITRFATATLASASPVGLCRSVNLELAQHLNIPAAHARRDDLSALGELLARAPAGGPVHSRHRLAVFIDAIDLLNDPAEPVGPRSPDSFRWLPPTLPPNVSLVLSVHEANADALAERFGAATMVTLKPVSQSEAAAIIDEFLRRDGRCISAGQRDALLERERGRWLPLSLRVASHDAARWPRWETRKACLTAATAFADVLGTRLKERHGQILVGSALGCLLASRDGLAEAELRELLADDKRVIADLVRLFPLHPLPKAKDDTAAVPDVVLSRLLLDLSPYLLEYPVEDQVLLRVVHDEFRRAAASFAEQENGPPPAHWHSRLAGYFGSQWDEQQRDPAGQSLNVRVVRELSYQRALAGEWTAVIDLVGDLRYLEALVTGGGPGVTAGGRGPIGADEADEAAEAALSAIAALDDLLALAERGDGTDGAGRQAAAVLRAVRNAIVRERRYLALWPQICGQQLANRLLADPDAPEVLTGALRRQGRSPHRAWLEIVSGGAATAAVAAYPAVATDLPRADSRLPAVSGIVSTGPRGPLIVSDEAGALASWAPAGLGAPLVFRRAPIRPGSPSRPGILTPLGDGRVLVCGDQGALEVWDGRRHRWQPGGAGSVSGAVTAMAYVPEDQVLVIATTEGTAGRGFDRSAAGARRWSARPGAQWLVPLPGGRVLAVAAGKRPGQPGSAACLRAADGTECWRRPLAAGPCAVAVDAANGMVAIGGTDRRVRLRDTATGDPVGADLDVGDVPTALAFGPAARPGAATLLVGRADGWLVRYPVPGVGPIGLLPVHRSRVAAITVVPEAAVVVTGGANGRVKAWDLDAGEWTQFVVARQVRAGAFDSAGQWALACCGPDGSYLAADGTPWAPVTGPAVARNPVLAPLPDARGVLVSLRDNALGWLPGDAAELRPLPLPPALRSVAALAAGADGTSVFAADTSGGLSRVPLDGAGEPGVTAARPPLTALAPLADGGVLAGDERGGLTTWTADGAGGLFAARRQHTGLAEVTALVAVGDRGAVVAGGPDGEVRLAHDGGDILLDRHGAPVTAAAVGLGGRVAVTASGGDDPALWVWDLASSERSEPLTRLPLPDAAVAVAFRPDQPDLMVLDRPGRLRRLRLHLPGGAA